MSFLVGSRLFHTSPRQAPFTWTFTEAVQFKRGAQGQNIGIVTQVMSHCSLWSSLYATTQHHISTAVSAMFNRGTLRNKTKTGQQTEREKLYSGCEGKRR